MMQIWVYKPFQEVGRKHDLDLRKRKRRKENRQYLTIPSLYNWTLSTNMVRRNEAIWPNLLSSRF